MPIYQITGKNGVVYRVNGPAGLKKEQVIADVLRQHPEAGVPPQGESVIEGIPLVGGVLGQLADYPATFVEGLAGTGEAIAASAGAGTGLTEFLKDVASGAKSLRSEESRAEEKKRAIRSQMAEQRGVGAEVGAALRNFIEAPFETTASVAGSAVPFIAAGALAPETGGTSLIPIASMLGLGAVAGAGTIKTEVYDAVYEETKKAGASEEQARAAAERAQEYGGENLDQIALGAALGGAAAATGFAPAIARTIGSRASARVAQRIAAREAAEAAGTEIARKSVAAGTAKGVAMEAFPEAGQAAQERYARNVALQREGFDVDPWQGVAGAAAAEGLASILLGGYGGARVTNLENVRATEQQYAKQVEALPDNPTDEDVAPIAEWAVRRGFNDEEARVIAKNAAAYKERIARAKTERAEAQREAMEARTAGVEPSPEPDIGAPPPVDAEEQAAMERAYAAEAGAPPVAPTGPIAPRTVPPLYHGGRRGLSAEDVEIVREPGATKQGKKGRVYGGFYATANPEEAQGYAEMAGEGNTVYEVELRPDAVVERKDGDITRLTPKQIEEYRARGVDVVVGTDVRGRTEYAVVNKDAVAGLRDTQPSPEAVVTPTAAPKPDDIAERQRVGLTPEAAQSLITRIEQAPELQSEVEAATGLTIDDLYDIAEGTQARYSRGRRPKDTATPDMFAGAPVQVAPGEALKRDEYNALRFASEEEKAAREQRFAEEMEAGMGRVAAMQQRAEEAKKTKLGELQQAIYTAHPSNRAYTVDYREGSRNPYRVLGPNGEVFVTEDNLDDFEESVGDLLPYSVESQESLAVGEVEKLGPEELSEPTVATRMIQEFVAEVDTARKAGQIDDSQRAELLRRLERPDAYKIVNGKEKPNDAIARNEVAARKAMERYNNAPAADKAAAEEALVTANQALASSVKNALLNPARAKMKSMAEMRQDEKLGARIRVQEAEAERGSAEVQARLGEMEDRDIFPLQRDLSAEKERVIAAKREEREAKIDLAQQRVQKYRKAPSKGGIEASIVQRVVDKITAQWKSTNPVVVVQSISDIPDAKVRRAIQRDGATDAEGLVAPDGTIYLIADNLDGEARAKAVLFHEGLGHVGLEKLFREKLDSVLNALYKGNAKLRAETDAWMKANPDAYKDDVDPLARAVEEVLAERSEAGRIEPSIFNRLAAIVRNFARRLGINLALSDADIDAILAAAHERTVNGPQESQLVKGMRYMGAEARPKFSRKKTDTSKADAKKLDDADKRLSEGARKVQKSFSTQSMVDGLEEMSAGHKSKSWAGALWSNWNLFSPAKQKAILKVMPSSGVLGWVKPNFPMLHEKMSEIDERVQKMNALKQRILAASDDLARQIQDFADEHGTEALATVQAMARINEVAPDEFASMAEALKKNAVIVEIERRLLKNSNNVAETRKLIDDIKDIVVQNKDSVQVKGDKYTMAAPLIVKLRALEKLAVDRKDTKDQVEQLSEMTRRVRDTAQAWETLGKQKGGHAVYKEMRSFYKDMFEAELALLDARIDQIADEEEAIRMKDMRAKLMREIIEPEERKKQGDLFWNIDADLFQKDYVPFMREGQYWLRVTADKAGAREREFYTFRTEREMREAQKQVAARLGVDPEKNNGAIVTGLNVDELQEHLRTEDALMQRVFDIVGKAREKYDRTQNVNLKELTDSIYQTWLMTTPERSVRRRLMHAEEVVGFSPDTFLHFREQATTYANQLSKLAYAGQIRAAVDEAREIINDPERPTTEKAKWNAFVSEFETRAEQEINPEPQNAAINLLNRGSYYYYLTSAKTALLQLTSIPIRVVPRLWRDYGYAKGTAMWIKYMKMWNSLGRVKVERNNTRYGDRLDALMPNVNGSQFVKNSPDLQWAKKMGMERGILETLHDTLVQNERATPGKTATGTRRAVEDAAGNVAKTMSFMFNGMENISRQASYYMTFELALEKYRKENKGASDEEARNYAFRQAMDMVRNTLGDYTSWERPSLVKGNLTRALFLFKMHPITQTRFLVGTMRDIVTNAGGERAGALKELSGVLMMAGMFGGLMGMPLYSAMTYALMAAFGPDEEDDEDVRALMGGDARTAYDPDIAFRSWMNDTFGEIKVGDASLADVLVSGPISTALNTELASSTSLDLKNMWFRDAVVGDSLEDTMVSTAIANIAGASMVTQMLRGYESFFKEGNIEDGLKKTLPAFFRTWVNAAVNETQGVKNRRGDTLIPKEDISAADNIRDALGFRAPKLARIQQYYITRAKNETAIKTERKGVLDRFERAWNEGDIKTRADVDAFIEEEVVPFNRTYPDPEFLITEKTMAESLERRAGIRARTVEGVQFDKKTMGKDIAAQERFVQ